MPKTFYVTTTLPYVNAKPHIGHAREFVQADVFARQRRALGEEGFFNTGTDEHGQKIFEKAQEENKDVLQYVDDQAKHFLELCQKLNIQYSNFIRTTDEHHVRAAKKFWQIVDENGYIYKKNYQVKYCVGCELEKTDSELVDGKCPDHPNKELEVRDEENYFFRFSAFQKDLLELFEKNPDFVKPKKRFNEIKAFVGNGLEDFSISRLKEKMSWGIEVPGDPDHVMYVWFDALVDYVSTLGWPENEEQFEKFWGTKKDRRAIQFCGKDNLRQQSAMWQAMLFAAGLPNSKRIYVNGFITVDGQKMSKSLGNVIDPFEMVEKYGTDATRYLLLSIGSFGEDTDITWEKLDEKYNADLANGLGNLVSRVVKLGQKCEGDLDNFDGGKNLARNELWEKPFQEGKLEVVLAEIWSGIAKLDKKMEQEKPWELAKTDKEKFEKTMQEFFQGLFDIAEKVRIFMPESAEKIKKALKEKKVDSLFIRL